LIEGFVLLHFASTLGAGGPDLELFLVAVALVFLGITFFVQKKTTKPFVPVLLIVGGLAAGAGAFANRGASSAGSDGTLSAPEQLSVRITSPADGGTVPARQPLDLEVEIVGGELTPDTTSDDPTMGHLHIFVDGTLTAMPATTIQKVRLEPGEHTLGVEFTTADHRSFEPRIMDEVTVTAQ
jgi:hypothetical protein